MSKPEIITTAWNMDKASWVHVSDNADFMEHIRTHLGHQLADRIFQECQKGERIVFVGEPYSQDILERYQIETRMDVRIQELVRCKDCRHRDPEDHKCDSGEMERQGCPFKVADDYFCAYGER
jgi:hypothetical protein